MMQHLGNPLTDQETQDILKEAGSTSGSIDYASFTKLLGVGLKQSRDADPEEEMQHAFKLFDRDNDGVITPQEMTAALNGFGVKLTEREVDQVHAPTVSCFCVLMRHAQRAPAFSRVRGYAAPRS